MSDELMEWEWNFIHMPYTDRWRYVASFCTLLSMLYLMLHKIILGVIGACFTNTSSRENSQTITPLNVN